MRKPCRRDWIGLHPEKGAPDNQICAEKVRVRRRRYASVPAEAKFIGFRRTGNGIQNLNLENCWRRNMTGQNLTHLARGGRRFPVWIAAQRLNRLAGCFSPDLYTQVDIGSEAVLPRSG
jgi:hypothetical protein